MCVWMCVCVCVYVCVYVRLYVSYQFVWYPNISLNPRTHKKQSQMRLISLILLISQISQTGDTIEPLIAQIYYKHHRINNNVQVEEGLKESFNFPQTGGGLILEIKMFNKKIYLKLGKRFKWQKKRPHPTLHPCTAFGPQWQTTCISHYVYDIIWSSLGMCP